MIRINNLSLGIEEDISALKTKAAKKLKIPEREILDFHIAKKSVDARDKADIRFVFSVDCETGRDKALAAKIKNRDIIISEKQEYKQIECGRLKQRPVIVGFGPAGMFAALILAQAGQCPIVLERGQKVEDRQKSVVAFWEGGRLDTDSNVQFGEGGAGTFSDGKLTTGTKDMRIRKVLEEFVSAGAPKDILYEAKPHLGTDRLPGIVKSIRETIISLGGEIWFESCLTGLTVKQNTLQGIRYKQKGNFGELTLQCSHLVLAAGHSARDIFSMCHIAGVPMEAKAFSVGARIEHLASEIDKAQYGKSAGHKALGRADYKLSCQLPDKRGVYTFCMCPGGYVTGAASETGHVVTNGMSTYRRDGVNSNAALLVSAAPKDFGKGVLDGVDFQRKIERQSFLAAGSDYTLPGQCVGDFLEGSLSRNFTKVKPTAKPGVSPIRLDACLPQFIIKAMGEGLRLMNRRLKGFAADYAVLTAPETRSSSPVRILRNERGQSPGFAGLYPCGEGAGYAGGIMSAAVDGIKTAEMILGTAIK